MPQSDIFIYKICTAAEWVTCQETGCFRGNDLDQQSGYLHLSLAQQVPRIVEKYFPDQSEIFFLQIPLKSVQDALKWEPNSNGVLFPHLYGALKKEDVAGVFETVTDLLKSSMA